MQMQQCPHCGAAIPATDKFCGECGRPIDAPAAQVAPPPQPPAFQSQAQPPVAPPAWQPQANPLATSTKGLIDTQNLGSPENLSIAGLVLGVISLCAWLVPICGGILGLGGIVLGYLSLKSSRRTLSIVAMVLGGIGLVLALGYFILGVVGALS